MKLEEFAKLIPVTPERWVYEPLEYCQTHLERGDIYDGHGLEVASGVLTFNADFIVAARTMVPRFIRVAKALKAERAGYHSGDLSPSLVMETNLALADLEQP